MLPDLTNTVDFFSQPIILNKLNVTMKDGIKVEELGPDIKIRGTVQDGGQELLNPNNIDWNKRYKMLHITTLEAEKNSININLNYWFMKHHNIYYKLIRQITQSEYGYYEFICVEDRDNAI